jgi:hypothetical protein
LLGQGIFGRRVDADRLKTHVRALAETFAPRDFEHIGNLDRAADYIQRHLGESGGAVTEQVFDLSERSWRGQLVRRGPYRNVLALFGPETEERIVVGAHYDAAGPYPGADDNASGVAALLELGRLFGQQVPPQRVELVAYSLEEPPYFGTSTMGSARHAEALAEAGVKVRAMICLESIGYFTDQPGGQAYPLPFMRWHYPDRGNFIAVVGSWKGGSLAKDVQRAMSGASPLPVHSVNAPAWVPGIDFSDHRSYWGQGYPAVMVTDTAFYRNPHYHTAEDRPEDLDYARLAMVADGVCAAVRHLAKL